MGSKPRMSEEEYLKAKAEIEDIKKEISALREKKNALLKRVRWYECSKDKIEDYSAGVAVQMFGKRRKDLTPDELREYNRERTRVSRARRKNAEKNFV